MSSLLRGTTAVFALLISVAWITPCFAQDPFAPKSADPSSAASDASPTEAAQVPVGPVDESCGHITSALCIKQNRQLGLLAGGYVLVCVVLVSVWRAWWNRRGTSTAGVRLIVPMLLGAAGSGLLVGFDPAQGADLRCCLAHRVLRAEILLQDSDVARAFLFGAAPAVVLYLVVAVAAGLTREYGGGGS
jgi:hypothetical protein